MIQYQTKTIDTHLDIDKMEVYIPFSVNGRRIKVTIPLVDDEGKIIDTYERWAEGEEFNTLYEAYSSDKGLLTALFPELDLSSLPDNLTNGGSDDTSGTESENVGDNGDTGAVESGVSETFSGTTATLPEGI